MLWDTPACISCRIRPFFPDSIEGFFHIYTDSDCMLLSLVSIFDGLGNCNGTQSVALTIQRSDKSPQFLAIFFKVQLGGFLVPTVSYCRVALSSESGSFGLETMARAGRVIILSIHQPRYSIYQMVDSTTMLAGGRLIYQGPPTSAIDFFSSLGFECPPYNNPADFFLDVITNSTQESSNVDCNSNEAMLIQGFKTSQWQALIDEEIKKVIQGPVDSQLLMGRRKSSNGGAPTGYATGWCHQFAVISGRCLKDVVKNPEIIAAMILKAFILSIFVGSLFFQLDDKDRKAIQDRTGVLFFLSLTQQFINISAVSVFIAERRLFRHEISNGYYRVSAYFLSKVICDLIPLRLLPVAIVTLITQFAIGLRPGWDHIAILFIGLYAVSVTSACICFLVGCIVTKDELGHIILSMIIALSNLYAGFLINFSSMPQPLAWIQYLSIAKYGFQILTVNEFADRTFSIKGSNESISGNDYLDQLDIDFTTTEDLLPNFLALGAISWTMLILAYLQLRCTKKYS
ncbi:ATP-binding cassette sub-family G member 2 [Elysia marginata]|uniref:ATP-binding cassette sub-family G member 2 n=1 Tax=Elysia marginata TaxID=1093978 RepID=A0AAV4H358_9GAST|nr:ATP-binding cassette sub-family G member 2 [Elysia marginata]